MSPPSHWLYPSSFPLDCLCIGTGRFLRAVLVPILVEGGYHPILVQPRGRSFLEFMHESSGHTYPVDTVLPDGSIQTDQVPCFGAFSWGQPSDRVAFNEWMTNQDDWQHLRVIGVGVTEAGLASHNTPVMKHLARFF